MFLLQKRFIYIDSGARSQMKLKKRKYLSNMYMFHFAKKCTFHSNVNIKCVLTIYGPGGAIKAIGNLRHNNASVKLPRCCHYFQFQVEGKSHNEGKYGNVTHGLWWPLPVCYEALSCMNTRTHKQLHSTKLICLTFKACNALCKEALELNQPLPSVS